MALLACASYAQVGGPGTVVVPGGGGGGGVAGPVADCIDPPNTGGFALAMLDTASQLSCSSVYVDGGEIQSTPGTIFQLISGPQTATTGASQAGVELILSASDATASTDTAGAAAGGSVTIYGGSAQRLTSGNANGGDINLIPGAGIGTGTTGSVVIPAGTASAPSLSFTGDPNTGIYSDAADGFRISVGGVRQISVDSTAVTLATGGSYLVGVKTNVLPKTNGVGSPFSLSTSQSFSVVTNEGATGEVYVSLPAASGGFYYFGCVQDSDGLRFTAAAGDTIRSVASVTSSGGYITSTTIGSCVTLIAINNTEWMAPSITGTWSFN